MIHHQEISGFWRLLCLPLTLCSQPGPGNGRWSENHWRLDLCGFFVLFLNILDQNMFWIQVQRLLTLPSLKRAQAALCLQVFFSSFIFFVYNANQNLCDLFFCIFILWFCHFNQTEIFRFQSWLCFHLQLALLAFVSFTGSSLDATTLSQILTLFFLHSFCIFRPYGPSWPICHLKLCKLSELRQTS